MNPPSGGGAFGRYRVLIADDSEAMRRILAILLSPDTFSLREVGDGDQALRAMEEERFDLLLTDLNMPNRDGLSTLRALRALEARTGRPRTPAIVISGHDAVGGEAGVLAAGADRHLTKPVKPSDLLGAMIELLVDPA
jgi:CheY-like chemotaxis protein